MSAISGANGRETIMQNALSEGSEKVQKSSYDPLPHKISFLFAVAMATVLTSGTVGFLGAIVGSVINIHHLALYFYIGAGAGAFIPVGTVLATELTNKSIRQEFTEAYNIALLNSSS